MTSGMQALPYIALAVLVAAAVGMQVWMARSSRDTIPESRRGLAVALRVVNIVLLVGAAGLILYALARWR